jgi:hypothetical protein
MKQETVKAICPNCPAFSTELGPQAVAEAAALNHDRDQHLGLRTALLVTEGSRVLG